jgi:hypothetical protein
MNSDDLSESYNYCYSCFHQFSINSCNESSDDGDGDDNDSNPFVFCSETCQYSYSSCDHTEVTELAPAVDPLLATLCDIADLDVDQFNPANLDAWFEYEDCDSGTYMPAQGVDSTSE